MRPLIFGEVLFDRFSDGTSVLGGAPFNVAWHLRGFGLDPLLISRIGDDPLGQQISQAMTGWGLDGNGLQIDAERPTGVVEVALGEGQHTFNILPDQAYDFMDARLAQRVAAESSAGLVYHGTLALRNPASRAALEAVLEAIDAPVYLDINLRGPWWELPDLTELCSRARWLKLNEDELEQLSRLLALPVQPLEEQAAALQERFSLDLLIVTRGAQGALARTAEGDIHSVEPAGSLDIVDTVGAGDAFTAVVLFGLIGGWSIPDTLTHAQAFANAICEVRGATVQDKDFYARQTAVQNGIPQTGVGS